MRSTLGRLLTPFRGFRPIVYAISVGQFINVFGSGVVYPFVSLYFYQVVGIPFTLVGLALLANNVASAAGTGLGGYLADRRGRKTVMVASMATSALTLSAFALVSTAPILIGVATAAGFTRGLYTPAAQAMVADLTDGEERERAYGLLKVTNNAGFGLGFVAGGLLYAVAHVAVFVVDGATSAVVAALLAAVLPRTVTGDGMSGQETVPGQETVVHEWVLAITRPRILVVALLNVGFGILYAQMNSTVPVFATETLGLSSAEIGGLFVLNPLVIVLFQLPAVSRVGSWRRTRGLVVSAGFWSASYLALALVSSAPYVLGVGLVAAFLVLRTLGEIFHAPLITALTSDLGTAKERGTRLSVLEVAKRLGFGIGPLVGGAFFDYGLVNALWPALIAGAGTIALGVLAVERHITPAENGISGASGD